MNMSSPANTAPADSPAPDWDQPHLVFTVDSLPYACPIHRIERLMLFEDAPVEPSLPEAPEWEAGRFAAQSGYDGVPVVSLRKLWGITSGPAHNLRERQALMLVPVGGQIVALLVDACQHVILKLPSRSLAFDLPRQLQGAQGRVFQSVIPLRDTMLVLLNLDELLEPIDASVPELAVASPALA